jgi:hypothetical protein
VAWDLEKKINVRWSVPLQTNDVEPVIVGSSLYLTTRDGGLVWMGPETERISPGSPRLFLGEDKAGAPVFAVEHPHAAPDARPFVMAAPAPARAMAAAAPPPVVTAEDIPVSFQVTGDLLLRR